MSIIIQSNLSPVKQNTRLRETYKLLTNIRVTFLYMDVDIMKNLIVTMIRSRLEYNATVRFKHKNKNKKRSSKNTKSSNLDGAEPKGPDMKIY